MADLLLKGAAEDAETLVRKAEASRTGWIRVHATDLRLLRDALRAALAATFADRGASGAAREVERD